MLKTLKQTDVLARPSTVLTGLSYSFTSQIIIKHLRLGMDTKKLLN